MLFHVELDAVVHLRRGIGKLTGVGHDQANLYGLLRTRRKGNQLEADNPAKT
jgi:hypothetical protein